MTGLSCVSLALITLMLLAPTSRGQHQICGICNCRPNNLQIFTIICDGENLKSYRVTSDLMLGAESATVMFIKNSQSVNIEKNSFAKLEKFGTLTIQNCTRLHLDTGAFDSLNSLRITKVHNVSLNPMALMGARGVKNVTISFSNFTELPKFSLFDLSGVENMNIKNVNFGIIRSSAFNISARNLTIANSTFNHIETDGFEVRAQTVLFTKNSFNIMERGAVMISTEFHTRFQQNRFEALTQLNITSPYVEMVKNTFENLQSGSVGKVRMLRFQNNTIKKTDLDRLLSLSNHKDFYDNQFECRCGLDVHKSYEHSQILKKNYCVANCSLSLFDFQVHSFPACTRNAERVNPNDFCRFAKTESKNKTTTGRTERNYQSTSEMPNVTIIVLRTGFANVESVSERNTAVSVLTLNWLFVLVPLVAFFYLINVMCVY